MRVDSRRCGCPVGVKSRCEESVRSHASIRIRHQSISPPSLSVSVKRSCRLGDELQLEESMHE